MSLDVLRGITVAGMIMVNNGHGEAFECLGHPRWDGLSICDFVFPFFLFIMGVSIFLSYSGRGFTLSTANVVKILRRTVLLIIIGLGINWLDKILHTDLTTSLAELRFWAVLQRIAVCYMVVSLFALTIKRHRLALPVGVLLLAVYTVIVLAGGGYVNEREENILWLVDESIFGYDHLYHYQAVDPEGLLSTISAVANVLFGFYCGWLMSRAKNLDGKMIGAFTLGACLVIAAFLLHFWLPFNKRIWSPTFACATSGACAMVFALLMRYIDGHGHRGPWTTFFRVFGTNALILYVSSEVMAIVFDKVGVNDGLFDVCLAAIPSAHWASLAYATVYMLMNWAIGYLLWRRRIFIKL